MRRLAFPLLCLLIAACAPPVVHSPTATPAPGGGIEGVVLIGPMCPVMRADTPCPDRPYAAVISVLDAERAPVAQFESDDQGRFRLALAPGEYLLSPESPDGFTRGGEQLVTVSAGRFVSVTIHYDSGIR